VVADALQPLALDLKTTMAEFTKEGSEKQESLLSSKNINQLLGFLNGLGDSLRVEADAEISMDYFHENNGPDAPHVGWQKPEKRSQSGSGLRGHIILDYVIAGRIDKKIDI
jgi:hypothetical protein